MKEAIRARAMELGFDACGITDAAPPRTGAELERWLLAGRHGDMAYLARNADKRIDPQRVLPGARSIISLATSYVATTAPREAPCQPPESPGQQPHRNGKHGAGQIARYAQFDDYHDVLGQRLQALTDFINQLGGAGARSLWYVDTGPLLERDLAQRAGIGFIGKHTNLISRRLGNWIFLCEILTTLELAPDIPEPNRCGSCARCIDACPTRAITGPFQLDARRCISYLTIELKGAIPEELRPALGARIYGCDDCLNVCPWNRFAREGQLMRAHYRADLSAVDLIELLGLTDVEFRRRFGATPIARAKRRGLLRNVCVALGNVSDARALAPLQKAAQDPEPLIAEHARWAIDQIEHREE